MAGILIHIGFHKTGTTFLQEQIFKSQSLGFASPVERKLLRDIFVGANPFDFDPEATKSLLYPRLSPVEEQGQVAVLSHEQLSGQLSGGGFGLRRRNREVSRKEMADMLHLCFPKAKILIIVREQRDTIRSIYKYLVSGWHGRLSASIDEFLDQRPLEDLYAPLFDFRQLEFHWLDEYYRLLFGSAQVLTLTYEELVADPDAFVRRICAFVELEPKIIPHFSRMNAGASALECRITRPLIRLLASPNRPGASSRNEIKAARLARKIANKCPRWMHLASENRLVEKINKLAQGKYAASNARLRISSGIDLKALGYEI